MVRRLAAVLAADIAGYSRLVEADESAALAAVKGLLKSVVEPKVRQFNGRIVKLIGDGILAEFSSAVDAVSCAIEIQCAASDLNRERPSNEPINYRIGINVGDLVVDGDDIFGDGVIIASRLEPLAEPGGICISENVLHHIRGKLDLTFEAMGRCELKNISAPVDVHRIIVDQKAARIAVDTPRSVPRQIPPYFAYAIVAAGILVVAAIAYFWWPEATRNPASAVSDASDAIERQTVPAEIPPTLAVLPFTNISKDKEQDYFSDGMTQDLITDLSKLANLRVLSLTTTATYKDQNLDIREIGKALNAKYIVEGSVRKAGNQIRINAQLTDAVTGGHMWADRYDGELNDIFGLQDQVLEKIVDTLAIKLSAADRQQLSARGTKSAAAHDLYLKGLHLESNFNRESYEKAVELYQQALSIDPDYPQPYMQIANILELSGRSGWSEDLQADLRKATELAGKAVELDPGNPQTYWSYGRAIARLKDETALKKGIAAMQKAIELDPDFADAYAYLAVLYLGDGRAEDGLRSVETAIRMNPNHPFWYLFMRGMVRFVLEDYELAITDFTAAIERSPTAQFLRWWLAAAYVQTGQMDEAEWQVEELYMMGFDGSISTILDTQAIRHEPYLEAYKSALKKAGIPEN